jgi:hypothetical protein
MDVGKSSTNNSNRKVIVDIFVANIFYSDTCLFSFTAASLIALTSGAARLQAFQLWKARANAGGGST